MLTGSAEYSSGKTRPPVIPAGEHSISSGSTNRTGGVGIMKSNSFIGHLLQVGSFDFAVFIGRRDIADTKVVREYKNDIRTIGSFRVPDKETNQSKK